MRRSGLSLPARPWCSTRATACSVAAGSRKFRMLESSARFSYAISTMGCKANLTDSQALEARLQRMGGVAASEEEADLFLLNTCTVTDQADKEARAVLRKGKSPFTI